MRLPDIKDVHLAAKVIRPFIRRTPVMQSRSINNLTGHHIYFKCENFQRTGAFKMRGASYAVACINRRQATGGVITHSSGNHAAALACAAQMHELPCEAVMPGNVPPFKQRAVVSYGAHVTLCDPGMDARRAVTAELMARQPGLALVHPFDDRWVIAGQATATLEFIRQAQGLQSLLLPVGGGGLISGAGIVMQSMLPEACLLGVEPEAVNEAGRSVADGKRYPATAGETIADGLQAGIGELNFAMIRQSVWRMVSVTELQIKAALRLILERLKIVVEPSAAVPLAALLAGHLEPLGQRVGIILTGGNIDLDQVHDFI